MTSLRRNAAIDIKKIFGYLRSTNQLQASIIRMNEEIQIESRRETRMKEHQRVMRTLKLAVTFTVLCIMGAFVSLYFNSWLFNVIFTSTILTFSGWSMWYTHRRLKRMRARWIFENLQRRVETEKK